MAGTGHSDNGNPASSTDLDAHANPAAERDTDDDDDDEAKELANRVLEKDQDQEAGT